MSLDEKDEICKKCPPNHGGYPENRLSATSPCKHRYTGKWICSVPCNNQDDLCLGFQDEIDCDVSDLVKILPIAVVFMIAMSVTIYDLRSLRGYRILSGVKEAALSLLPSAEADSRQDCRLITYGEYEQGIRGHEEYKDSLPSLVTFITNYKEIFQKSINFIPQMCYSKHFAPTMTSISIASHYYNLEMTFNSDNKRATDMFFFLLMGDSDLAMFMYDHMEKSLMVKFKLWLIKIFGHRFCRICSRTWRRISLSFVPNVMRLVIAMAASYVDLFKDIFFTHLIWEATLKSSTTTAWNMNSVPAVVFVTTIGSIVMSEVGKLIVLLGSPEFYKWYERANLYLIWS